MMGGREGHSVCLPRKACSEVVSASRSSTKKVR